MISSTANHQNNQHDHSNSEDELTASSNALNVGEKTPLLNAAGNNSTIVNVTPPRTDSPLSHCHVPDEKFDYGARNRLLIAFLLSLVFVILEIVGKS